MGRWRIEGAAARPTASENEGWLFGGGLPGAALADSLYPRLVWVGPSALQKVNRGWMGIAGRWRGGGFGWVDGEAG
jgi:hypothetical protein